MTLFPLGVYVGNPDGSSAAGESQFEADYENFANIVGAQPKFLDLYVDQMKPVSEWINSAGWQAWSASLSPIAKSLTPVIAFPMASGAPGSLTPDQYYKNFSAGLYDNVIRSVIKQYADNGFTTQYWRPGWEFNLNSQPHYAGDDTTTQADWVAAFQHIANVMHSAGVADGVNIKVVWNTSITNYTNAEATTNLYPGNQYVDIIGADVYSDLHPYVDTTDGLIYDWSKSGQTLNSPNPVFSTLQQWASDPINLEHYYNYPASGRWSLNESGGHSLSLSDLISFAKAQGKPFAIAETGAGSTSDGAGVNDNPVFVKWLSQTLVNSAVQVAFINVWDSNGGSNYAFSAAGDNKPTEAAAWKTYFGSGNQPVDTAPPSLTVAESLSGASNAKSIVLSGAVSDLQSGVSGVEVFDFVMGKKIDLGASTIDNGGHWIFSATGLSDGNHQFSATAKDIAGNVTTQVSAGPPVIVDTIAPQPAIRTITGNRDGGVTLSGVSEANSIVAVTDSESDRSIVLGSVAASSNGAWQLTSHAAVNLSTISRYTVSASDAAGNSGLMAGTFFLGGTGVETLTGTPNASDVFAIMSFRGSDIINGFQTSSATGSVHDFINFSGRGITSFSQVKQMMSGISSTIINIGSGKTITLTDVTPASLTAADFRYS